jgi:RNA polymerase sigma-70 factor (ECF subfamily)
MSSLRPSDDDLIRDLRAGVPQALSVLFDRYGRLIFDVARKILHDPAEAEDLTQDVLLEIYRKAHQYDSSRGSVKGWLLQYAYHRSYNRRKYLALRRFYDDYPADGLAETELAGEAHSRQGLTEQEWKQTLSQGMAGLNPTERTIIGLVVFDGLTVREASEQCNETYVNARNLYYRGLKKLRSYLGKPIAEERGA